MFCCIARRLLLAPEGSSSPAVCDLRFRCSSQIKNSQLTNQKTGPYALVYGSPKGYTTILKSKRPLAKLYLVYYNLWAVAGTDTRLYPRSRPALPDPV